MKDYAKSIVLRSPYKRRCKISHILVLWNFSLLKFIIIKIQSNFFKKYFFVGHLSCKSVEINATFNSLFIFDACPCVVQYNIFNFSIRILTWWKLEGNSILINNNEINNLYDGLV
jgi:hypothetical protein